jgi:dTDP-4-dehydrorhamnose 3,5-epimerase
VTDSLPDGVKLISLESHADFRGRFSEIFRAAWGTGIEPIQWNLVTSEPHVLRGVHVHLQHTDYLLIARGHATIGLKDLRDHSPTTGLACTVDMNADKLSAIVIPPGVAHGFYFHEPSMHIYAVSHYWNEDDELGCHWADPDLGIPWQVTDVKLSERDTQAKSLASLKEEMRAKGFNN